MEPPEEEGAGFVVGLGDEGSGSMSEVVFILGAGASAHAGVPLMARFLDEARRVYSEGIDNYWEPHFELVFRILVELQKVHSKAELDLSNIEAVFTTFELGQTMRKLPGVEENRLEAAVSSLKLLIVQTIECTMRFPLTDNGVRASKDYEDFASLLKKLTDRQRKSWGEFSVLTFNYDVGLEVAFALQDLPYGYCLNDSGANATKLLKLHGSVNWGKVQDADEIVAYPMEKLLEPVQIMAPQLSRSGREYVRLGLNTSFQEGTEKFTGRAVEESPIIVPPGLFKTEYQGAISRVWQQAGKELEGAEEVIVLGSGQRRADFLLFRAGGSELQREAEVVEEGGLDHLYSFLQIRVHVCRFWNEAAGKAIRIASDDWKCS